MTNETSLSTAGRITDAQTTEERFLRKIFIRDQMSQFARDPLLMARFDNRIAVGLRTGFSSRGERTFGARFYSRLSAYLLPLSVWKGISCLQADVRRHGIIGDIRGKGLFQGIEFVKDPKTAERFDPPIGTTIGRRALQNGLLTRFDPHWLAIGPPMTIDESQIDEIVEILDRSIGEVLTERGAA